MVLFFSLASLALLPAVLAQGLLVNTPPSVVQCEPTQISWTGGTAPYFLSLIPAGQASAAPIKQFAAQNSNALTWSTDIAAGTSFTIALKDNTGNSVFSSIVTVQSGPNSNCINTSVTENGSGGAAVPTTGVNSASAPGATITSAGTSAASSGAKPASSGSASSTGSAASSSSSTKANSASSNRGNALAVAGVMGLVGAALF